MICTRPLQDKDIAYSTLDVDRDNIIRFLNLFELRMNQSFIKIKDKRLLSFAVIRLRAQKPLISPESRLCAIFI